MPIHDFRCINGHVSDHLVRQGVALVDCPFCDEKAEMVFLTPPKLDWAGMAQGENAGPEFVDRFERSRRERVNLEQQHVKEHGDAMRGAGG